MVRISHRCALLLAIVLTLASCAAPTLPGLAPEPTALPTATLPPPTPTPPTLEAVVRVDEGGFSLSYPGGWATRVTSATLALAPTAADLDAISPGSGLVVQIDSTPLDELERQYGPAAATDPRIFFEISSASPLQAGYTLSATIPITLNGSPGLAADLSAAGGAGQLIVLMAPPRAVRVLAQATPAAWAEQRALFAMILDSLTFFAPAIAPTATPADQAVQPLTVTKGPPGFVLRLGGDAGPGGGRFARARGMAVAPDGTLYLAEMSRGIWVFAPDGALVTTFGKGRLLNAYDVARGPNGDLFVADDGNKIVRFSADGTFLRSWGAAGPAPDQFGTASPQRIAAGADGSVYVLDSKEDAASGRVINSVVRFRGDDASFIERIALPAGSAPVDLAVDGQGNIFLAEPLSFNGAVVKLSPDGKELARFGGSPGASSLIAESIDIDALGNIYLATSNEGILLFAPNGAELARGGSMAAPGATPAPGEFGLPNGIAAGPGGIVWVSDNSNEYSAVTALRLAPDAAAQADAAGTAVAEAGALGATGVPSATLLRQWAASATASSAYEGYEAGGATGPPDVAGCQDSTDAWASADPNGLETIELRFDRPVFAVGVIIHQNHQPGFISRVEVLDERGSYTTVYSGIAAPQSSCPLAQAISFAQTAYRVTSVKLTVDQRSGANWNEIDAVELLGVP